MKRWTKSELKFLNKNYSTHGSKYCSSTLNRSHNSIKEKSNSLGLYLNPSVDNKIRIESRKKKFNEYNVNPFIFTNVKMPEVAYLLGLLWADGHIFYNSHLAGISFCVSSKDGDDFIPIFKKIGQWSIQKYFRKKIKTYECRIRINNRPLAKFLFEHDYTSKYKSADKILSIIPDNLKHYWFRGLFDGDGCICIDKNEGYFVSISGPYDQQWNYLSTLCGNLNINFTIKKQITKFGRGSQFILTDRRSILKFGKYIYNDFYNDNKNYSKTESMCLWRKYKKYLNFLELIGNYTHKGVSQFKTYWIAYTHQYKTHKSKHLKYCKTKTDAINIVKKYYGSEEWPIPFDKLMQKEF